MYYAAQCPDSPCRHYLYPVHPRAGCTSLKSGAPITPAPTPVATETQTVVTTPVTTPSVKTDIQVVSTPQTRDEITSRGEGSTRDAAFNALFLKSAEAITNKTVLVIQAMVPGTTGPQFTYSPTVSVPASTKISATHLQNYYNQMLTIKADTPENEAKRIAYIQFLYTANNAAYNIANAAEAESYGDYQGALSYLKVAKIDLQNIREDPALATNYSL